MAHTVEAYTSSLTSILHQGGKLLMFYTFKYSLGDFSRLKNAVLKIANEEIENYIQVPTLFLVM